MLVLSLRSLRLRPAIHATNFLAMFFAAVLLMSFGALFDTAGGVEVNHASRNTLETLGLVVGGWSVLLVTFAVTSMLTLQVRQRASELSLLTQVGATAGQLTRMVAGETAVLALLASGCALVPAAHTGRAVHNMLSRGGQITETVPYRFGGFAIHLGVGIVLPAALIAALVATRRVTRGTAIEASVVASVDRQRISRTRRAFAAVALFLGLDLAIVTITVTRDDAGYGPMATAGPAAIWSSIGLSLLAPPLLQIFLPRLASHLTRLGAAGHLVALHLRNSARRLSGIAAPLILFTGIAIGTLCMTATDNAARAARSLSKTADYRTAETTNLLVVGLILLFTGIMVVNTLIAATLERRREFGQQRLVGATRGHVLTMVVTETIVVTFAAGLLGSLASLCTVIPFALARQALPLSAVLIWLGVMATAAALSVTSTTLSAHHALRKPAIRTISE